MTQVIVNGNTYSDDGTTVKDMLNGGHRTHFFPMVQDTVTEIDQYLAAAAGLSASSTSSVAIGTGSKVFTVGTGKGFAANQWVKVQRTSTTDYMWGVVTSYAAGDLTVDVQLTSGSGTYTTWTVGVSGPQGATGTTANLTAVDKSALFTAVLADNGKLFNCTGTWTLSLTAAATLGAGWFIYVNNIGTGQITIDPNGAELIGGAATYTLKRDKITLIHCTGTAFNVIYDLLNRSDRYSIFDSATATMLPRSSGEDITYNTVFSTGLSGATRINFANSLFIAEGATSQSNVATSADGQTWTLRAMTAAGTWAVATDGNNCIARAGGATTINKSTNSTTWSAATALGANANNNAWPIGISGTWLVHNTTTTVYRSTDFGVNWTANTLPANLGAGFFKVNGKFWYFNSGTTAYWSDTGATSSWTSVTLPITPALFWMGADGFLYFSATAIGSQVYKATNHNTFDAVTNVKILGASTPIYPVNSIFAAFDSNFGEAGTYHGAGVVFRQSTALAPDGQSVLSGSVTVVPANSGNVITINSTNSPTALFERQ